VTAAARIPGLGEPDALTPGEEGAVRRAARSRGAAIIVVLLDAGVRAEQCACLDAGTSRLPPAPARSACTERGDEVRFVPLSKRARDLVSAWLDERGRHPGPAWHGQRGPLTIAGITQVVLAAGAAAGIPGLRPHRRRHTFGTRLRLGGAGPAQVRALLGHASLDASARYFRAGAAENAAAIERIFEQ